MLIEVQALGKISSPFVIKYYGSFLYDDRLFIVTEYAGNGDLHQLLRQRSEPLDEPTVWKFILQVGFLSHGCQG